jgi:competence protein ComGC
MKKPHGYSIIELILFLCITGILIFLAIPFLKSFSNTTSTKTKDAFTETNKAVSNTPLFSTQNPKDSNQSTALPSAD